LKRKLSIFSTENIFCLNVEGFYVSLHAATEIITGTAFDPIFDHSSMRYLQQCLKNISVLVIWCLGICSFFQGHAQDSVRKAFPELIMGSMDFDLNGVRSAQQKFPQWRGLGRLVSVKEERPDLADIDLRNRYLATPFASSITNSHASLMTTIIAGAGNSWYAGRGVAPAARFTSADFANLNPEPISYYTSNRIHVQNHSYGVGIENFYGSDAQRYDSTVWVMPSLLHVFSAGNRGTAISGAGNYSGIPGFANLTGSFKMAKNALVVGAVDSFGIAEQQSSRGPAHDGRVKPELVAFGEDGSSGAAALVSGLALLIQEAYLERYGSEMDNALARAVLINAANDLGNPGPDYTYGFGNADAEAALNAIVEKRIFSGVLAANAQTEKRIDIPDGIMQLKVTLAWTDPPAAVNAQRVLQHNLDLELVELSTGKIWQPWVLSSFPNADSLRSPATRRIDTLNNVEQVSIDVPAAGGYLLRVRAGQLKTDQAFHICWQLDSSRQFQWISPLNAQPLNPGARSVLRWKASKDLSKGSLSYSLNKGSSWQLFATDVDLWQGYLAWNNPSGVGPLLLKMETSIGAFASDTLILSDILQPQVGFTCTDSMLIFWNPVPGADGYRVYGLNEQFLESKGQTSALSVVLANKDFPENQVAIAPRFQGLDGYRSRTFNHTTQGAGCYIKSLLAEQEGQLIRVLLEMGTIYALKKISLQKWIGGAYVEIAVAARPDSLRYLFRDQNNQLGTNRYRVQLELLNGRIILSDPAESFIIPVSGYRIFPNPVARGNTLQLAMDNIVDEGQIQLINASGQLLRTFEIKTSPQSIDVRNLAPGLYYIRVVRLGQVAWTTKCIIR
jgi:hypothetical protein